MVGRQVKYGSRWSATGDADAQVWCVAETNMPGLSGEAPTPEAMSALLHRRVRELLELNLPEMISRAQDAVPQEIPFELLWRREERISVSG